MNVSDKKNINSKKNENMFVYASEKRENYLINA